MVRLRDGELASERAAKVHAHLTTCESCKQDWLLLRSARQDTKDAEAIDASPQTWDEVRDRIRQWESKRCQESRLKSAVGSLIIPFLGKQAAEKILALTSESGSDLLSILEPVLGDFLGPAAASALITRIVDLAIVQMETV